MLQHLTEYFHFYNLGDHVMSGIMKTLYHSFNFITGYKQQDPKPQAIEWRLIVLESFAGIISSA